MPEESTPKSPFESPGGLNVEAEARKTMDSSWDNPFHSIGKGATQAAAGNHKHSPQDLTHNHDEQYAPASHGHAADYSPVGHGHDVSGASVAYANSAGNADTVDGQHLNWSDPGWVPNYVWGVNDYDGNTFLIWTGRFSQPGHSHAYGPPFNYGRPLQAFAIGANMSTGDIAIAHGLGRTPVAAFVSADDDGGDCSVFASVRTWDATYLYAKMRNIGGDEAHVYINWIAF